MPIQISLSNAIGALQGLAGGGPGPGPGPGYTPPLDAYPALVGYSVRKLSSTYTGAAIEAYRVSDGATQDIGFDSNGLINTADIISFASGSDVRVSKWYDQSGSGFDITNSSNTLYPLIYESGSITESNSIPALKAFNGEGLVNTSASFSFPISHFAAYTSSGVSGGYTSNLIGIDRPVSGAYTLINMRPLTIQTTHDGYKIATSSRTVPEDMMGLYRSIINGAASNLGVNGQGETANLASSGGGGAFGVNYVLHSGGAGNSADNYTSEVILFPDAKAANDTLTLESNINSYYQITNLPDYTSGFLADYPDAAAAYSVRQLSNTAIKCMRVRRAVPPYDEQDIGFTAGGDLDEAAIVAFGGSDVLNVSAWYDQSGQSRHATQINPNSQPQIYDGAAVITENGKAALDFISNSSRSLNGPTFSNNSIIGFCVAREVVRRGTIWGLGGGLNYKTLELQYWDSDLILVFKGDGTNYDSVRSPTLTDDNAQHLVTLSRFSNALKTFVDGTADINTTDSYSANSGALGFAIRNTQGQLLLQEAIFYETDQDAAGNRTGIETDIMTYYNIP